MPAAKPRLTLFDLDHTLLDGDSDVLWCEFLMDLGHLDRVEFARRNAQMESDYRAGTVTTQAFSAFYVATLAGRSAADWEPLRRQFLHDRIAPRLDAASHALVKRHIDAGDLTVLSTATNRFLSELSAAHLGFEHLIATDCEVGADGCFTGGTLGTLNMRDGKVARLHAWLGERGLRLADCDSTFYSDSLNDLPLLLAVDHAVAVNPDPRLALEAQRRAWTVLSLRPPA